MKRAMILISLAAFLLLVMAATALANDDAASWSVGILTIGAAKLRTSETRRR